MAHLPETVRQKCQSMVPCSNPTERECNLMNDLEGTLTGYDCPKCKNKGTVYRVSGNEVIARECDCMQIRRSVWNIEKSGLKGLLNECTFQNFIASETWQKTMKTKAEHFLSDHDGKWFYAGGQVGGGKTHICTAICGELLKQNKAVRYMLWRDESVRLKASVNDDEEYARLITPLKTAPALYVDDFLKTSDECDKSGNPIIGEDGNTVKKKPTQADINVAFEILNYRYINPKLITIISSERSIDDLIACDEAVGSRIYQRTKDYCCYVTPAENRNYRLR